VRGNGKPGTGKRCPECGTEIRVGDKRCLFCGLDVSPGPEAAAPARRGADPGRERLRAALAVLRAVVAVSVVVGIFVFVGRNLATRGVPDAPPRGPATPTAQAAAACEDFVRGQVRPPFRLIAFRSSLVAEERGAYVVTGTVELQSVDGVVKRRKYRCQVRANAGAGMVVDEGRLD
jgi:hypothetical protein